MHQSTPAGDDRLPVELPPLISEARNAVGDTVFARNAHGTYSRPRTVPTDPNTGRQQRYRARFATVVARWSGSITQAQRDAWNVYAKQVWHRNRIGCAIRLSGFLHFVRLNQRRQITAFGWIDMPPTELSQPTITATVVKRTPGSGVLSVVFSQQDEWATQPGARFFVFTGVAQSAGINFYAGPFRRATIVHGSTPIPPVLPHAFADPYGLQTAPRCWFRAYCQLADGRVSVDHIIEMTLP